MMRIKFTITIAIIIFTIFTFTACKQTEIVPDLNVYPIDYCDLVKEPNRYDGKLVRIKAVVGGVNKDTPAYITESDCDGSIRFVCAINGDSCSQMYSEIRTIQRSHSYMGQAKIDVIGRYTANIKDPNSDSQNQSNVQLFEIYEIKGIETIAQPSL